MVLEKVIKIVAEHLEMEESEITAETTLADLGVDSLDTVEILMEMEDEFGITIDPGDVHVEKVGELADYIASVLDK